MGTCMQGERALRVVVGTGSDGVVGWARAIGHAIRQNQTCTQTSSDAMIRRTWSDGVVGWASNASVRASMAVPDDGGNQRYSVVINGALWQDPRQSSEPRDDCEMMPAPSTTAAQ